MVRSKHKIVAFNERTLPQLNETLAVSTGDNLISVTIPPETTLLISDLLNPLFLSQGKTLVIEHAGKKDTNGCRLPL